MIKLAAFFFLTLSVTCFSSDNSTNIIYGVDNRIELFEGISRDQSFGTAVAGMIETKKLIGTGSGFMLPPATLSSELGVCEDERFKDQPTSMLCTGFLVSPNLIVTAGHCVSDQSRCEDVSFVFDYKLKENTLRADIMVPKKNVYRCSRVVEAKHTFGFGSQDYALVEIDRVVEDVVPLAIRTEGIVKNDDPLVVIGHPSGLPLKVSSGAKVIHNEPFLNYFISNLDTYGGNSGSPVFNDKTGIVEGILVRGNKDYILDSDGSCRRSNSVPDDHVEKGLGGESVNRITSIKALMKRNKLFEAIKAKNVSLVKNLIDEKVDLNLLNEQGLSPFEAAAISQSTEILNLLVANGAKIDLDTIK